MSKTSNPRLEQIEAEKKALDEERRAIYRRSLEAPEDEKLVADSLAEMLLRAPHRPDRFAEPREIMGIEFESEPRPFKRSWCQKEGTGTTWVSVRPCAGPNTGSTLLGVLIGEVAIGARSRIVPETSTLHVSLSFHNPLIFIPKTGQVVLGAESWWGEIESPEALREITNEDIDGLWYMQAMKSLSADQRGKGEGESDGQ